MLRGWLLMLLSPEGTLRSDQPLVLKEGISSTQVEVFRSF